MRNRLIINLKLGRLAAAVACAAVLLFATPALSAAGVDCSSCHDQAAKLTKSAHASLACETCHTGYNPNTHPAGIVKPDCTSCHAEQGSDYALGVHGQARKKGNDSAPDCGTCHGGAHELLHPSSPAFRTAAPDTCGMCHSDVADQYRASVHGKAVARGVTQAPICNDCHGEHKIIKPENAASTVNGAHIRETCGNCHGDVRLSRKFGLPSDRIISFDSSYHGLAAKAGSQSVANCASCHGVHNILPSSDPKSTINARNLPATCGKCHPGAGSRFAISQVHLSENGTEPTALRWVRQLYLLLIPVTIGLMLAHNLGDWVRKLRRLRFAARRTAPAAAWAAAPAAHGEIRMMPFERVQHAALVLSFLTLVWTGFALKFPEQAWARPLLALESKYPIRSLIHRIAAGVFLAVSFAHLFALVSNRKLRDHWKEMWPNLNDPREALSNFAWRLGLGDREPYRSPHSYVEKAEYWAVVWGAVVMAATGILLWANSLFLRFLPKLWLDVATSVHFYEAVLATLAIVVWHFYSVIFDPDVYPLDTAFLTGRSVRKKTAEHPAATPHPGQAGHDGPQAHN